MNSNPDKREAFGCAWMIIRVNYRKRIVGGICLLGLVLGFAGCATEPQDHLLYSGPLKAATNDAVILFDPGLVLVKCDGQDVKIDCLQNGDRVHVLPGKHVLTVHKVQTKMYYEDNPLGKLMSAFNKDQEVKVDAEAGGSYQVMSQKMAISANSTQLGDAWFATVKRLR